MNYIYEKHQLVEVISQLRFPTILSVESQMPAEFQETIRQQFPRFAQKEERLPEGKTTVLYSFISQSGQEKITLSRDFIAFSTVRYRSWRDFAAMMDEPLGQFIRIYRPVFFQRIGLRYVNGFSREALGLEDCPWRELIAGHYLGPMGEEGGETVLSCSLDWEQQLPGELRCKGHSGPGFVRRQLMTPDGMKQMQEKQQRFVLDLDVYSRGELPLSRAAELIEQLHGQADRLFSDAITDKLHEAMEPIYR